MSKLPIDEELDFHYLLTLMQPLSGIPEYSWLPELFAILGHEQLLLLAKYAGGEVIRIPTTEEIANSIQTLRWFYRMYIKKDCTIRSVPSEQRDLLAKIKEVYDAGMSGEQLS